MAMREREGRGEGDHDEGGIEVEGGRECGYMGARFAFTPWRAPTVLKIEWAGGFAETLLSAEGGSRLPKLCSFGTGDEKDWEARSVVFGLHGDSLIGKRKA